MSHLRTSIISPSKDIRICLLNQIYRVSSKRWNRSSMLISKVIKMKESMTFGFTKTMNQIELSSHGKWLGTTFMHQNLTIRSKNTFM
jgi:hypothetical protein